MRELVEQICFAFKQKNYDLTIELFEEYLSYPENGIYPHLLALAIESYIQKSCYATAAQYIDAVKKFFPGYYNNKKLACLYAAARQFLDVKELIKDSGFTRGECFDIGKECFYSKQYDLAKELFERSISYTNEDHLNEFAREFLEKINNFEEIQKNKQLSYIDLQVQGKTLEKGHIVYVEYLSDRYEENRNNTDPKKEKRPYMIWEFIDNHIYAFPLAKAKSKDKYVLFSQNYPDCDFDRAIKDKLVVFDEHQITRIVGKVNQKDYEGLVHSLYTSLCYIQSELSDSMKFFSLHYKKQMNVTKGDVIAIVDKKNRSKRLYFVIKEDKDSYKLIEVSTKDYKNYQIIGKIATTVPKESNILYKKTLAPNDVKQVFEDIEQLPYDIDILGHIINYMGRKLQVMLEREDHYICINKSFFGKLFPSSYIEIIPKLDTIMIDTKVDKDDYKKELTIFLEYLKQHQKIYSQKYDDYTRKLEK